MPRAVALVGWAVHHSHGLILCSCLPAPAGPWLGPWGGILGMFLSGSAPEQIQEGFVESPSCR